jgi:hypothetical protein
VARREVNRVYSKWLRVQRQRRWEWSTARVAVREWGEETPSKIKSSGGYDEEEDEDKEEGE